MTDNEIFENNLTHFQVVKKYQDRAQCKCPAHQDKQASLTVTKGRKCTLLYCHAGCQLDDILNAAGLEKRDIFYESTQNTANWRAFIEKRENNRIEAVYNYVSCNGQYAFTKVRLQGKHIIYGRLENERFTYGLSRNKPRKSYRAVYGNLSDIKKAIDDNKPILINNAVTSNRIEGKKAHKKTLESTLREIHAENYETSDKGNARLFADIFKDKHRYCSTRKDFMLFDGKRWIDDLEGLSARKSAKELSDALIRYAVTVDTDGKYLKAVTPLCNLRNRNNMLQDSRDLSYFTNEQLDVNDYILNVQNGTLDLSGDKPIFMEHSPDMLLSKICNVNYEPGAKCEVWEKFINEIMQNDKSKIEYLQKIAGLSLTGNTSEETAFILYGSTTRNGKSTLCETLIYLLGDYALTMRPETLATKQNTDSRQANGDVARLCGCRFVNASEPPKRMLFDTALLKSLLGRDSITARFLHQREFEFIPKFKLVINTNYLPVITDDTIFSSGRLNVVSFDRHFEPHEQDKHLKDKLRRKEELSGILNWCLDGLRLYRKDGLKAPAAVQKATNAYRADSDKIGNFINECLKKTDVNSKAKEIYDCYVKWCADNGYGIENKGNFFAEMKNKGLFATSGTVTGKTVKNVIKGYVIDTDFQTVNDDSEIPFC